MTSHVRVERLPTGTVTFLFTDVEGSTRLLAELGERYGQVQDDHMRILREAIAGGGGLEIRTEGDAFFAVFASAVGALRAAVHAQRALAAHEWPHGESLRVRMGMHTGEGRLGGDDYLGIDVNRAARIAAAGHGGQVLVSAATGALVEHELPDGVKLRDLGEHRLKDFEHPQRLHDLVIDGLPSEFPPLRTLGVPTNLPTPATSFVGREREVEQVTRLLEEHRLVTLTGPGGTGKTRLAIRAARAVAERFADGAFFVDLSAVVDPGVVPSEIAGALGVAEDPSRSAVEALREHLRERELLLVLDNFEQVVDAAPMVRALLEAAPRLHVLVTSRTVLRIAGEQELAVPPLRLPDPARLPDLEGLSQYEAVALFIERARASRPDFTVTNESAPAVAEICARLDGLPLAIELAASRINVLSPGEILGRLDHRLGAFAARVRDVPERQRTLRAAIGWSHDLLDDRERRLFARMSVFAGGATLASAEAVANPDGEIDTLDGVASLVEQSLLRVAGVADGETRYGMLETIREFARERLAGDWDAEDTARRHAGFFLALAEEAEPRLTTEEQGPWLDRCEREHDNIRAVLRWSLDVGDAETGLRIVAALWRFWQQRGHLREGLGWAEDLLALAGERTAQPTAARARGHSAAGGLAWWLDDVETTARHYERGAAIARELGDRKLIMEATYNLAFIPLVSDQPEAARSLFEESLAIARELGDRAWMVPILGDLAYVDVMTERYSEAVPLLEEVNELARKEGQRFRLADGLQAIAYVHARLGDHDAARERLREAMEIVLADENLPEIATTIMFYAVLAGAEARHERAARLWAAFESLRESVGGAPAAVIRVGDVAGAAREAIGEEAADRAVAEGREMDLDQAVAYALEEDE